MKLELKIDGCKIKLQVFWCFLKNKSTKRLKTEKSKEFYKETYTCREIEGVGSLGFSEVVVDSGVSGDRCRWLPHFFIFLLD